MALLSIDERTRYFHILGLGDYNEDNIKKVQKKYLRAKDVDGKYGTDTDNLLRHLYNVATYTKNFSPTEFRCECGGKYCTGYPTYMKPQQLTNLQSIRSHYGKPMTITSGMRCRKYNSVIGGSIANSKHLTGQATDFYMAGVTDTLANRKSSIKWMKKLPNTTYIYGNGINSNGASVKAPYMGNALHYDSADATPSPKPEVKKLTVDGIAGPETIRAAQTYFGTVVDGYISGQNKSLNKYYPSVSAVIYGKGGSTLVKKMQSWAGASADGIWGESTSKALQKTLGVKVDGIFGKNSMKAFQTFLNNQLFPENIVVSPVTTTVENKTEWKGIDVSDWQDKIDWVKVKNDGIDCAIIRYADGDTLDKRFAENMKGAIAAGLHVGCYIFSRAKTKAQAEKEAERLFNAAKSYATDMPLYIDLEVSSLSKYGDTVAAAFLNKMKALGGWGGVYANLNWWENYLKKTAANYSASPFWIAQYNTKITHKNPKLFGIWQYSSKGRVNGIGTAKKPINVDMDKIYVAYWENSPGGKSEKTVQEALVATPAPVVTSSKYTGELPTNKLKKTTAEVIEDAMIFGRWIASDKRFGYGRKGGKKYKGTKEYSITHSGGCHFCGTNASKIKRAKKAGLKNPEEWEYTCVCNVLVHSCYAHGGVPAMLKASNHSWWIPEYQKSKDWKEVKKPSKITDCHPGDVFAWDEHFCMYLGNGKGVEATSMGVDPAASKELWEKSIRVCDFSKHFKQASHIFRYVGTVNSTTPIRYGEVSTRVALLQKYLKWKGYDLTADKIFGDGTLAAVKKFQKAAGLKVDGIVGPATLAKMAEDK